MSTTFLPQSKPASERNGPEGWQTLRCEQAGRTGFRGV